MSITITLQVPTSGYWLSIREVRETAANIYVLAHVGHSQGTSLQVISTVTDTVHVALPQGKPVKKFVVGKTWNWGDDSDITFIAGANALPADYASAKVLFTNPAPEPGQQQAAGARYIVSFKDKEKWRDQAQQLVTKYHLTVHKWFDLIAGFVVTLTNAQATEIAGLDFISAVDKD